MGQDRAMQLQAQASHQIPSSKTITATATRQLSTSPLPRDAPRNSLPPKPVYMYYHPVYITNSLLLSPDQSPPVTAAQVSPLSPAKQYT